jgi:hypothetical protein
LRDDLDAIDSCLRTFASKVCAKSGVVAMLWNARANLSGIDWNKIARRGYVSFATTGPPHEPPTCNIRERQMPISQALQLLSMQPQAREAQWLPPMRLIEPTFAPHKI